MQVQRALAALAFRSLEKAVFDAIITGVSHDHVDIVVILPELASNACDYSLSIRGPIRMDDNMLQFKRHVVQLDAAGSNKQLGASQSPLQMLRTMCRSPSVGRWVFTTF